VEYLDLLRRHDHPRSWEYPTGFDYDTATRRFGKFTEALSALLKLALKSESGSHIQDASFHSRIYVPLDSERYTLIRFSNFGDMATVSEDEPVPEELMRAIVELLEEHSGFGPPPSSNADRSGSSASGARPRRRRDCTTPTSCQSMASASTTDCTITSCSSSRVWDSTRFWSS